MPFKSESGCGVDLTTVALIYFIVGSVFFVAALVVCIVLCIRWRRRKDRTNTKHFKDRRKVPPSASVIHRAETLDRSGQYIEFCKSLDESTHEYDYVTPGRKVQEFELSTKHSEHEFEETYDGSRMPKTMAPPAPCAADSKDTGERQITDADVKKVDTAAEKRISKSIKMGTGAIVDMARVDRQTSGEFETYTQPEPPPTSEGCDRYNDGYVSE